MELAVLVVILEGSVYSVVIIANILAKSAEGNKETNLKGGSQAPVLVAVMVGSGHGWSDGEWGTREKRRERGGEVANGALPDAPMPHYPAPPPTSDSQRAYGKMTKIFACNWLQYVTEIYTSVPPPITTSHSHAPTL